MERAGLSILRMCLAMSLLAAAAASSAFGKEIWAGAKGKPKAGEVRADFAIVSIPEKDAVALLAREGHDDGALFASVAKLVAGGRATTEMAAGETAGDGGRSRIDLGPAGVPLDKGDVDRVTRINFIAKRWDDGDGASLQVRVEHFLDGPRKGAIEPGKMGEATASPERVTTSAECRAGEPLLLATMRPSLSAQGEKAPAIHFVFVKIELAAKDKQ